MTRTIVRWAAAVAAAGLGAGAAPAANVISVNFTAGSYPLAAGDSAGVVAAINWNNVIGNPSAPSSGSNIVLNDSTGLATTALLTYSAATSYDSPANVTGGSPATNTLFSGSLNGSDVGLGEVTITVTNIPYASYAVYAYGFGADASGQNVLSLTDGTTTYYYVSDGTPGALTQTTSTDPNSPTVGLYQYQVFAGKTGASFTLTTGGSITNVLSNNIAGFQIVEFSPQAVPEPASVGLLAAGALGAAGLRLRRRRTA